MRNSFMAFIAVAVVFFAIGFGGRRPFIFLGMACVVIALLRWRRSH